MTEIYSYFDKMPVELVIDETIPEEIVDLEPTNPDEKESKNKSNSLILYHLRVTEYNNNITGDKIDMSEPNDLKRWLNKFSTIARFSDKFVASIEHFKKGMNPCLHHCHIYFLSYYDKERIRKNLLRWFDTYSIGIGKLSGNKKYSLSVVPNQNEKAFKYAMKQQKNETFRALFVSNPMKEYILKEFGKSVEQMRDEAYAVWITACEVADAKEKKMEDSKLFQDRLFAYLDKKGDKTDLALKMNIQMFYIEVEGKPFNAVTAKGHLINYKITRQIQSHVALAETW